MRTFPLENIDQLPIWRRPIALLVLISIAVPIAFSTWLALLNNFVIEVAQFDGADIGLLHSVREIPGFFAVGVIAILLFVREQVLGLISLALLGVSTAVTAYFPTLGGILMITFLSSVGFHYFETVNQSLQLQWLSKERAPRVLGILGAVGSAATLLSYGLIVLLWEPLALTYNTVFMIAGGISVVITLYCFVGFPQFKNRVTQRRSLVLRKRYWLYYALQFFAGARRQIFIVFAGFMMVERFGFDVHQLTTLYMVNLVANIALSPLFGVFVARYGERRTLLIEYAGLILVFLAYGGIYFFGWGVVLAMALYIVDHMLFALRLALSTYFQKIADPADIAPTAAVAFTINHIAAVFLPVLLGLLWVISPGAVFFVAAGIGCGSFGLALLVPRHPEPGYETRLALRSAPVAGE
jgi:predicted MFS family arabinose efflux permease